MSSSTALLVLVLLSLLPLTAVCLTCYECAYPAVSPLICIKVSKICSAGQRCLYSTAKAINDLTHLQLEEKSCAAASKCGVREEKRIAGLDFTYTTSCCDSDLCNAAGLPDAPRWSRSTLSLGVTAFTVMLASM